MTVPKFGRITPLQGCMLALGGEVVHTLDDATHDERIQAMLKARSNLKLLTGQDFGYDIQKWHDYLLSSSHREQYTFPYAWKSVHRKVLELFDDPRRLSLIAQLPSNHSAAD